MQLHYALCVAANSFRTGYTAEHAAKRIEELRGLLRQCYPQRGEWWIDTVIPVYTRSKDWRKNMRQ